MHVLCNKEVFKESKSLLFKSLRVQRIYDKERNTLVYVSFNTRLDKNDDSNKSRFKSSLCAVNLDEVGAMSESAQGASVSAGVTP
jgi:catabolite regulation protein CreA